jgi:hypothetical protein
VASTAIGTATAGGRPGPATSLDFAKVHAAVHDAVQAIVKRYKPYYRDIPGASGSPDAATAKAAHDVLVHLFPAQAASLDAAYDAFFAANHLAVDDPGVLVGQQAAAGIINLRLNDGSFPQPSRRSSEERASANGGRRRHSCRTAAERRADAGAVARQRRAVHARVLLSVPSGAATDVDQPRIREGLQRGEGVRLVLERGAECRSD